MFDNYTNHNLFRISVGLFCDADPQLSTLAQLKYQHKADWWSRMSLDTAGIYILTGGRQVGKSTSCKLLIKHCLQEKIFNSSAIFYLPCDEIYDATTLGNTIRGFLEDNLERKFLLIIDEVTYVKHWDRAIKALADEGCFKNGCCIITGSDSLILQEAAMHFPGRRGDANQTDFHLYPLSFKEYVNLVHTKKDNPDNITLSALFKKYQICGGYLRAINDLEKLGEISQATFSTYEQWIRGDFLKHGKNENSLLAVLHALLTIGVSQVSYSKIAQKVGAISKDTCIDYIHALERMDILIILAAFDQNKKQGFPRKDRKFHFLDPFIYHTIARWLQRLGYSNMMENESVLVESIVASNCYRVGRAFYFKGKGEIDVIWSQNNNNYQAIEVKWANTIKPNDLKMLKQFPDSIILGKNHSNGTVDNINLMPVYKFLYEL